MVDDECTFEEDLSLEDEKEEEAENDKTGICDTLTKSVAENPKPTEVDLKGGFFGVELMRENDVVLCLVLRCDDLEEVEDLLM